MFPKRTPMEITYHLNNIKEKTYLAQVNRKKIKTFM